MSVHRPRVTDDRPAGRRIVVVADSEETDRRRPKPRRLPRSLTATDPPGPLVPLPPSPAPSTRRALLAEPPTAVVVVFSEHDRGVSSRPVISDWPVIDPAATTRGKCGTRGTPARTLAWGNDKCLE